MELSLPVLPPAGPGSSFAVSLHICGKSPEHLSRTMKKYMYSDYENRDEVFNTSWAIKEKLFGKGGSQL